MPTLQQLREKHPATASLSDADLIEYASGVYNTTPEIFKEYVGYQEPKPKGGGFMASAKQSIGSAVKGAGQAAGDFIPGVESDNALKRYGQGVIDANPTVVHGFDDALSNPLTTAKEATGNAVWMRPVAPP